MMSNPGRPWWNDSTDRSGSVNTNPQSSRTSIPGCGTSGMTVKTEPLNIHPFFPAQPTFSPCVKPPLLSPNGTQSSFPGVRNNASRVKSEPVTTIKDEPSAYLERALMKGEFPLEFNWSHVKWENPLLPGLSGVKRETKHHIPNPYAFTSIKLDQKLKCFQPPRRHDGPPPNWHEIYTREITEPRGSQREWWNPNVERALKRRKEMYLQTKLKDNAPILVRMERQWMFESSKDEVRRVIAESKWKAAMHIEDGAKRDNGVNVGASCSRDYQSLAGGSARIMDGASSSRMSVMERLGNVITLGADDPPNRDNNLLTNREYDLPSKDEVQCLPVHKENVEVLTIDDTMEDIFYNSDDEKDSDDIRVISESDSEIIFIQKQQGEVVLLAQIDGRLVKMNRKRKLCVTVENPNAKRSKGINGDSEQRGSEVDIEVLTAVGDPLKDGETVNEEEKVENESEKLMEGISEMASSETDKGKQLEEGEQDKALKDRRGDENIQDKSLNDSIGDENEPGITSENTSVIADRNVEKMTSIVTETCSSKTVGDQEEVCVISDTQKSNVVRDNKISIKRFKRNEILQFNQDNRQHWEDSHRMLFLDEDDDSDVQAVTEDDSDVQAVTEDDSDVQAVTEDDSDVQAVTDEDNDVQDLSEECMVVETVTEELIEEEEEGVTQECVGDATLTQEYMEQQNVTQEYMDEQNVTQEYMDKRNVSIDETVREQVIDVESVREDVIDVESVREDVIDVESVREDVDVESVRGEVIDVESVIGKDMGVGAMEIGDGDRYVEEVVNEEDIDGTTKLMISKSNGHKSGSVRSTDTKNTTVDSNATAGSTESAKANVIDSKADGVSSVSLDYATVKEGNEETKVNIIEKPQKDVFEITLEGEDEAVDEKRCWDMECSLKKQVDNETTNMCDTGTTSRGDSPAGVTSDDVEILEVSRIYKGEEKYLDHKYPNQDACKSTQGSNNRVVETSEPELVLFSERDINFLEDVHAPCKKEESDVCLIEESKPDVCVLSRSEGNRRNTRQTLLRDPTSMGSKTTRQSLSRQTNTDKQSPRTLRKVEVSSPTVTTKSEIKTESPIQSSSPYGFRTRSKRF